jgi:hypothetical protein
MFTAIQVVQVAALVILLLALLVLFCAIDLIVDLKKKDQDISGRIVIRWLFLSYSKMFYPTESKSSVSKKEQDAGKKKEIEKSSPVTVKDADKAPEEKITNGAKNAKKKKELKAKDIIKIFNTIKTPIFRLFRGTMRNLRLRCGRCDLSFGLPDPADTGMLSGFLFGAFGSLHQYWQDFSYFLEPRFDEKVLDMQLMADVRLRIYRFIPVFLRFALDRGVLRTGWLLVRTYR